MKLIPTIAGAILSLSLATAAQAGESLALGSKAPLTDTKLKNTLDGKDVTLGSVAGPKGTLVVFTCTGCPYARAWESRIVEIGNGYAKKGIGVVALNANDPGRNGNDGFEGTQQRAKEKGFAFPYAIDPGSKLARAFGARVTPEAFLFDKAGKLVYHGTIDDNADQPDKVAKKYLIDALDAVLTGKAVPTAETKSLGCGIKFGKDS